MARPEKEKKKKHRPSKRQRRRSKAQAKQRLNTFNHNMTRAIGDLPVTDIRTASVKLAKADQMGVTGNSKGKVTINAPFTPTERKKSRGELETHRKTYKRFSRK